MTDDDPVEQIGKCTYPAQFTGRLMIFTRTLWVGFGTVIMISAAYGEIDGLTSPKILSAKRANGETVQFAHPPCFSDPTREDTGLQNWFVDNKCGTGFQIYFQRKSGSSPAKRETAYAAKCERTRIINTFLTDVVTDFTVEYDAAAVTKPCGDSGRTATKPPAALPVRNIPSTPSSSSDLSGLVSEQNRKAAGADEVNRRNSDAIDDIAEERKRFDEAARQQALRQRQIEEEDAQDNANEFIGGFIQGLGSVSPPNSQSYRREPAPLKSAPPPSQHDYSSPSPAPAPAPAPATSTYTKHCWTSVTELKYGYPQQCF